MKVRGYDYQRLQQPTAQGRLVVARELGKLRREQRRLLKLSRGK